MFAGYGQILSCKVVQSEEGKSLGYGYIQFASAEAATRAIATKPRGSDGQEVCVQRFVPKNERDKRRPGYTNIYVRNFPKSVATEEDLLALFGEFGEVSSAFLAKVRGVVEYEWYKFRGGGARRIKVVMGSGHDAGGMAEMTGYHP